MFRRTNCLSSEAGQLADPAVEGADDAVAGDLEVLEGVPFGTAITTPASGPGDAEGSIASRTAVKPCRPLGF